MHRTLTAVSFGSLLAMGAAWAAEEPHPPAMKDVPKEMRTYYLAFLVAGPKFAPDSPQRAMLVPKHLAFIREMITEKKFLLAGPFIDEGKMFGITVIAASSADEAKAWMGQDPAVQAGFFGYEIHSAMLPSLDSLRILY